MRIKNKEIRRRRQRKEQIIKGALREIRKLHPEKKTTAAAKPAAAPKKAAPKKKAEAE